ncbi:MAG: phosphoribosyltransferase regulatory subunit [Clostridiales bacterium]|nr:phosphoribosyltransferase regulatory subunit [Clostridiales bacterium]
MESWKLHIPEGTQDYLIDECYNKEELEHKLTDLFHRWGYRSVETPIYEYYDVFSDSSKYRHQEEILKFVDRNGRIAALRPDMTVPVARMVATKMASEPIPLRLCYCGDVFRYDDLQAGRQRQFTQVGVELVGSTSVLADAELIALTITALKCAGLDNPHIVIGQVGVFKSIIEESGVDQPYAQRISQLIDQKNIPALAALLDGADIDDNYKEILLGLPQWFGDVDILDKAEVMVKEPTIMAGLDNIYGIYDALVRWGLDDLVSVDLSIIPDLDYYTGMVFNAFVAELGYSICGGGRYDNLLANFGTALPATGFAIGIKRLMLALERQGKLRPAPPCAYLIVYDESGMKKAFERAAQLRQQGFDVIAEAVEDVGDAAAYASERGIKNVLHFCRED